MAQWASNTTGNFSTSGIWSAIESTSFINSETLAFTLSTSYASTPSITLGSTTTIDGVGVRIFRQLVNSGTMTVTLALAATPTVAIASVVINVSDLNAYATTNSSLGGWAFFKFGSSQTLTSGVAYTISLRTSVNSTVQVVRSATGTNNFSKYLRTTTTGTPASSGDDIIICGDMTGAGTGSSFVVTNDNTSSNSFNTVEVGNNATFTWANSASTNYQLNITATTQYITTTSFIIGAGATFRSPTSFNSTSNMTFNFTCTGASSTSASFRQGSTINLVGATKTPYSTLAADLSAGSITSLTTATSTGWSNGDLLALPPTQRVVAQYETVTMTGNASGTSVPVVATLSFAHSGTSPFQAQVGNLTRNIKFVGTSTSNTFYIYSYADNANFQYCQFRFFGGGTGGKRGIQSASLVGATIDGCSFHDPLTSGSILVDQPVASATITTVSNCVFYQPSVNGANVFQAASTNTVVAAMTLSNCLSIGSNTGFQSADGTSSFTNCYAYGAQSGFYIQLGPKNMVVPWAFNTNYASSCVTGHNLLNISGISTSITNINNINAYRNTQYGLLLGNTNDISFTNINSSQNGLIGVAMASGSYHSNIYITNLNAQSNATFTQQDGLYLYSTMSCRKLYIFNSSLGTVTSHVEADISGPGANDFDVTFVNCTLGSTTKIGSISGASLRSKIGQQKIGGVAGANQTNRVNGILTTDAVIFDGSPYSERIAPSSSANKIQSTAFIVGVASGNTFTLTVKVRKSSISDGVAYNGNQPRLLLLANPAAGSTYNADIVCATASAAAGTWETLSYTLPVAVTDNTGLEFVIDGDGTAGFFNIDTFTVT